jgi:hypothetical protein
LEQAAADPERWLIVDGKLATHVISRLIWQQLQPRLIIKQKGGWHEHHGR